MIKSKTVKQALSLGLSLGLISSGIGAINTPVITYAEEGSSPNLNEESIMSGSSEDVNSFNEAHKKLTNKLDGYITANEAPNAISKDNINSIINGFSYENTTTGSAVTIKAENVDDFVNDGFTCSFDAALYEENNSGNTQEFNYSKTYAEKIKLLSATAENMALTSASPAGASGWTSTSSLTNVDNEVTISGIKFKLTDSTKKYVSVSLCDTGMANELVLPSIITCGDVEYSVTNIDYCAFRGCSKLTKIKIPGSVTSIGNSTFERCSGLTNIKIPSSVTSIGKYAFDKCIELKSIEIPNGVTSIGYSAFGTCHAASKYIVYSEAVKNEILNSSSGVNQSQILVQMLDSSTLQALYNANKDKTQGNYTDESFNAFTEALNNAKTVFNNINTTQSEADAENIKLKDAIAGLKEKVIVTGITISGTAAISQKSGSITLTANVAPEDAFNKAVTWSTVSESSLASLSDAGVLTAGGNGNGNVVVRATAKDGSGVYGEKTIVITNNEKENTTGGGSANSNTSSGGSSSGSSSSGNSSTEETKSAETTVYGNNQSEIQNDLNSNTTNTIVIILDNSNGGNNTNAVGANQGQAGNTPVLSEDILKALKANPNKTIIIKTVINNNATGSANNGNEGAGANVNDGANTNVISTIEVKSTADGHIQFTQNNAPLTGFKTIGNEEYALDANGIIRTGWIQKSPSSPWEYYNASTGIQDKGWIKDNNIWYYLDTVLGDMKTGWFQDKDGSWYFLNSNGKLAVNTSIDGYTVGKSGALIN